jgi:S-adenosylmethionine:tRNA ribosyltransferase-isomerase
MQSIANNDHSAVTLALKTSNFDFSLPPELIAQHPAPVRSTSRLLDGSGPQPVDRVFSDLPSLLESGDLLVFNDTLVVKARLFGEKSTGGKLEMLIERVISGASPPAGQVANEVVAHLKVSKKPRMGGLLCMAGYTATQADTGFTATLVGRWPTDDGPLFRFVLSADPYVMMEKYGCMPLPPYIERDQNAATPDQNEAEDNQRYQTVFAKHPGAVAAPTAALHFDQSVLTALEAKGVQRTSVTLHVGAGTFQPVKVDNIADHQMHFERYSIPPETIEAIKDCKARGGKIVAVGTTSVRSLETWGRTGQTSGDTNIFITPGFQFQVVDTLITNFHLPKSTLMMLVSAFAGYPHVMALYQHAIAQQYRFFSYGDSMLLQRSATPSKQGQ